VLSGYADLAADDDDDDEGFFGRWGGVGGESRRCEGYDWYGIMAMGVEMGI